MNIPSKRKVGAVGFTLIELLIVIGIIILLLGIVIVWVQSSKDKAVDVATKKTLSEIALQAESQEIASGATGYQNAFTAINAPVLLQDLATKLGIGGGEYEYAVSDSSYAIVFPLKKGGYYCVDSFSSTAGREVTGLFPLSGEKNCSTATRAPSDGNPIGEAPQITLHEDVNNQDSNALCGAAGGGYSYPYFLPEYAPSEAFVSYEDCVVPLEASASSIDDADTYDVYDYEDGLAVGDEVRTFGANVQYVAGNGQSYSSYSWSPSANQYYIYYGQQRVCKNYYTPVTYTVTDSDGNTASATRKLLYCDYSGYPID